LIGDVPSHQEGINLRLFHFDDVKLNPPLGDVFKLGPQVFDPLAISAYQYAWPSGMDVDDTVLGPSVNFHSRDSGIRETFVFVTDAVAEPEILLHEPPV
jgi:hypothetical protein